MGADAAAVPRNPPDAGLRTRWKLWRNRRLSDPGFHRWAARLPLLRSIAARESAAVFDLCAGFVYSQVLLACVESGVLRALDGVVLGTADLARVAGLSDAATDRLLTAAASLRLVEPAGERRWVLGPRGAAVIGVASIEPMVRHHRLLYEDLRDPLQLLRGGVATLLGRYWSYAGGVGNGAADVAGYSELMAVSQELVAADVIDAYPFARHARLLDVGGGEGAFAQAVARRVPGLAVGLFDLPSVAARARERCAAAGLATRIEVRGGDFRRDPLPTGYDLMSLVRVLHDHDDDVALALLSAVRAVLPAGGVCLVAEPMSGQRGAEAMADAYFGFYLLAMGQGSPRSPLRIAELAQRAGFVSAEHRPTRRPLFASLVVLRA